MLVIGVALLVLMLSFIVSWYLGTLLHAQEPETCVLCDTIGTELCPACVAELKREEEPCPLCDGTGEHGPVACEMCNGSGWFRQ
jgi:DnaJ-class molecular chaperone